MRVGVSYSLASSGGSQFDTFGVTVHRAADTRRPAANHGAVFDECRPKAFQRVYKFNLGHVSLVC